MSGLLVIAENARGQYQGQRVGEHIRGARDEWEHVSDDDLAALLEGPDGEHYDEAFATVLDDAEWTFEGRTYTLRAGPSGDILAGCEAAMTAAELADWIETDDDDDIHRVALRLAVELSAHFETAKRPSGEAFDRFKEGSPSWMHDVVRDAAHDGARFLPNDHSYSAARSAVDAIAGLSDDDDADDALAEFADSFAAAPRWELVRWLSEAPDAFEACNEARADFGPADGLDEDIQRGRYVWARNLAAAVLEALRERAEDMLTGDA